MYRERKAEDYSNESELTLEYLIDYIGFVELQIVMNAYYLDPNPSVKVKQRLEDIWIEKDEQKNYESIINKYKNLMYLYNALTKKESFISVNFLKSVVDYGIEEHTYKEELYGLNEKEKEIKEIFNSVDFKSNSKYSEKFAYHITHYIRNKNNLYGENYFINNVEENKDYLEFKTFSFKRYDDSPVEQPISDEMVEEIKRQIKLRTELFKKENICEEHRAPFCEKCFYQKYKILGFQLEYITKNGDNDEKLNYRLIRRIRKSLNQDEIEEINYYIYERAVLRKQ
jgi:hypothetical protein